MAYNGGNEDLNLMISQALKNGDDGLVTALLASMETAEAELIRHQMAAASSQQSNSLKRVRFMLYFTFVFIFREMRQVPTRTEMRATSAAIVAILHQNIIEIIRHQAIPCQHVAFKWKKYPQHMRMSVPSHIN
jgi:hypothetical protein